MQRGMTSLALALLLSVAGCVHSTSSEAQEPLSPADVLEVLASTVGDWRGSLVYIDYQSNQRFGIPLDVSVEITPDNATLVRNYVYTDPNNLVYAVSLLTANGVASAGEVSLTEAYFRDRRGEQFRYRVESFTVTSDTQWRLVYSREGTDDERPATIRQTLRRNGDSLSDSKEVRYHGDDSGFILRNVVELERLVKAE